MIKNGLFSLLVILAQVSPLFSSDPIMIKPSWEEIHQIVTEVSSQIHPEEVDMILGITVGGMVPAALFSKCLGIKNVNTISASSYVNLKQRELKVWNHPPVEQLQGKNILIVDDIADSGKTVWMIKNLLLEEYDVNSVRIATVYVNASNCLYYPDYWGRSTQDWIDFPWDEHPFPDCNN